MTGNLGVLTSRFPTEFPGISRSGERCLNSWETALGRSETYPYTTRGSDALSVTRATLDVPELPTARGRTVFLMLAWINASVNAAQLM